MGSALCLCRDCRQLLRREIGAKDGMSSSENWVPPPVLRQGPT